MRTNFKENVQPFLGKRGDRDIFFLISVPNIKWDLPLAM